MLKSLRANSRSKLLDQLCWKTKQRKKTSTFIAEKDKFTSVRSSNTVPCTLENESHGLSLVRSRCKDNVCFGSRLHSQIFTLYSDVSLDSGTTGLKVKISVKVWPEERSTAGHRSMKQTSSYCLLRFPFPLHPSNVTSLIIYFPPLHPYVSTGPVAALCCLASGRTVVLPSPPLVLWTRWSKAAREPLRQLACSADPAITYAPALTQLRKEEKQNEEKKKRAETGTLEKQHILKDYKCSTLWISCGKHFLEVFLFHFWKTSDVVLGLREEICTFNFGTNYTHDCMWGAWKTHLLIMLSCQILPPVLKP